MAKELRDVFYVDGVRTAFGKARPTGFFAQTRADDMVVKVIREILRRNPEMKPEMVEDNIWGATTQMGDQGLTMGRTTALLAGLSDSTPGCSVDRMCAGGMTAVTNAFSEIAFGAADIIMAGGVEHMGHHPMGQGAEPNPRFVSEKIVDPAALNMGITAENIHDLYPQFTQELADQYSVHCQQKAKKALDEGKLDDMIIPMTVWTDNGWVVADRDQQPRPEATLESMKDLRKPFRKGGRVTPGNSSGLNDGAAGCLFASAEKAKELGLKPKMRPIAYAFAGVKPEIMGLAPVPATKKVLEQTGMSIDDMDYIELNEAFAVQALAFIEEFGMKGYDDPRLNPLGGAIAFGHPLASSGPRLMIHLAKLFADDPKAKYGLTTMCVGLGQGGSVIWENVQQ